MSTPQKLNVMCRIYCNDVIVCGREDKIEGNVRLSMVARQEHCHLVQDTVGMSLHWTQYLQRRCKDNNNGG
jgi:hypothetical protein